MRNPKTLGLLRGTKITLEAHIKMNTPIPFCQFENSPCKEACPYPRVLGFPRSCYCSKISSKFSFQVTEVREIV